MTRKFRSDVLKIYMLHIHSNTLWSQESRSFFNPQPEIYSWILKGFWLKKIAVLTVSEDFLLINPNLLSQITSGQISLKTQGSNFLSSNLCPLSL